MKMILLVGPAGCGKTTTLRMVREMFRKNNACVIPTREVVRTDGCDMEVMFKHNSKNVVLFSKSDYSRQLLKAVSHYRATADIFIAECDYLVAEMMTGMAKVSNVVGYVKNEKRDCHCVIVEKTKPYRRNMSDENDANTIMEHVSQVQ